MMPEDAQRTSYRAPFALHSSCPPVAELGSLGRCTTSRMSSEATYRVVKRGEFLYDGSVRCGIEIVQTDFRPGTGDHDDPPELRDDIRGTFYEIRYQSAGSDGRFSSGVVGFESVESAMSHVDSVAKGVRWL